MSNQPKKQIDLLKIIAETNKRIAETNKILEQNQKELEAMIRREIQIEKEKTIADSNLAHLNIRCKSCEKHNQCKLMQFRISDRAKTCVLLRFERSYSKASPKVLLPMNLKGWKGLLNDFLQFQTQYDSGLPGIASTHKYYLNSDRNKIDLTTIHESRNN